MDAGDGINTILNDTGAHLTVDATASASAENGTKTFGGTAEADANSTATSTAKGVTGGTARDVITNNGDMDIDAYANAKAVTNAALCRRTCDSKFHDQHDGDSFWNRCR